MSTLTNGGRRALRRWRAWWGACTFITEVPSKSSDCPFLSCPVDFSARYPPTRGAHSFLHAALASCVNADAYLYDKKKSTGNAEAEDKSGEYPLTMKKKEIRKKKKHTRTHTRQELNKPQTLLIRTR